MNTHEVSFPLEMPDRETRANPVSRLAPAEPNAGKVVIHTHGCKLNQADSSILARQFRQAGYSVVEDVEEADIFVLNTCTVTATADSKARQSLRAARRANPDAVIVAAGCYPQRAAEELENMPAVTLVVGNEGKDSLVSMATAAHRQARSRTFEKEVGPAFSGFQSDAVTGNLPGRSRGMVKIQEGCDQVCAYCIVPKVRGRERSIPPREILAEVRRRIADGCKEVALTGTQLGTYGFDLPGVDLQELLRLVLNETDLPRLRVSSLQPQEINGSLLALWVENGRLCPHFHVPLQSGSDPVLKSMRRRYTTDQFSNALELIRQAIPAAGITADLIVGFPGEGEAEFADSLAFVEKMQFSDVHVFPYSRRPGTSAVYLEGQVTAPTKKQRMARALAAVQRTFEEFRKEQRGSVREVLWEGIRDRTEGEALTGLTDNYIRVECGPVASGMSPLGLANSITSARLGELQGNNVMAEPVSPEME